ncbi:MAG: glycosyltransferase family 39 protein [Lachnospiraceae bacterium]|nr:glycosyltransferase family 39 protein [Lachnospiraceae bacterium]
MNRKIGKKIIYILPVLAVFLAAMLVLTHTAQNGVETTEILPTINPDPVYVVCESGKPLEVTLRAKEDFSISGFQILVVNVSEESRGTLRMALTDSNSDMLMNQVLPVENLTPGKWIAVSESIAFAAGQEYQLSLLADGSEPYFMQVPEGWGDKLPFEETVLADGEALPYGISIGINRVEPTRVIYGDIFYYSIPACILITFALIVCILFGTRRVMETLRRIPVWKWICRYGNELFLVLLFVAVCISIYSRAYLNGIFISADSTGYMREAINLVNGNGFRYDGLAGYSSWFANWPILYPAMIALMMLVTKVNAYLASKLVAMLIVGIMLVILRICFKKDAWVYALCLTNIGFLNLCYYTWSEIPFMLFQLGFALVLARILQNEKSAGKWYVLLGTMGLCCFLTRYYGIYVWIVTGLYILALFVVFRQKKDKAFLDKSVKLTITAFVSGVLSLAYLMMNKLMNGMASGVSRTMWWDDYRALTDDLIESLLTEFFNIFSLQIPELLENFPYNLKVFAVLIILVGLGWFVIKNCRRFTRESVLITMAVMYYLIFICIRYVSSMDSFYFRFFEPGTFLLCIGVIGLLLPYLHGKKAFRYFGGAVTALVLLAVVSVWQNGGLDDSDNYYEAVTKQWEEAYTEIPERSVIIFNDIDFRSSWYRSDVVDGTITPADTLDSLRETYYGSEFLCIRAEFVETMLELGEYEESVHNWLEEGLHAIGEKAEFVVLPLNIMK